MNFAGRAKVLPELQAHLRTDAGWISFLSFESYPQAWFAGKIAEQFCFSPVLTHDQVHASISVEITDRSPALFAINSHTTLLSWNSAEISATVSFEPQTSACVIARSLRLNIEE